jgi:hypothetical protein
MNSSSDSLSTFGLADGADQQRRSKHLDVKEAALAEPQRFSEAELLPRCKEWEVCTKHPIYNGFIPPFVFCAAISCTQRSPQKQTKMMTSNLSKRHNIMVEFATVQAKHWIKMRILNKVGILESCKLGRNSTDLFANNAATNTPSKPLNIIIARFVWL